MLKILPKTLRLQPVLDLPLVFSAMQVQYPASCCITGATSKQNREPSFTNRKRSDSNWRISLWNHVTYIKGTDNIFLSLHH